MALLKDELVGSRSHPLPLEHQSFSAVARPSNGAHLLAPLRSFDPNCPEMIDQPGVAPRLVREELEILESANRRFGGHRLALRYVRRLIHSINSARLSILDLATGAADVPRAIAAWCRQRQLPVNIIAVDGNSEVLHIASESCRDWPEIRLEQYDLRALPYPPASYDLVLCSLALHHFDWNDAVAVLRRIQELARIGYVVTDLRRNWAAIWTAELLAHTLIRSEIARHDGPQSCRAAFTVGELHTLARQAGLRNFQIKRHHLMLRMVLEGRK